MLIGVATSVYRDVDVSDAFARVQSVGADAVEFGTGGWPGGEHADPQRLLVYNPATFLQLSGEVGDIGVNLDTPSYSTPRSALTMSCHSSRPLAAPEKATVPRSYVGLLRRAQVEHPVSPDLVSDELGVLRMHVDEGVPGAPR